MLKMPVIAKFASCDRGATSVEYGLIMALIFLAAAGGIANLGDADSSVWSNVSSKATKAMSGN